MKWALLGTAGVVAADQITKYWAESRLSEEGGGAIELLYDAQFKLVYNPGAAFSTGANLGQLIAVFAVVMTVFLIRLASKRPDKFGRVVLCVIAGGVIGNFIDRLLKKGVAPKDGFLTGEVVDFIDVGLFNFAVFNIADSAIVVGTIILIGQAFLHPESAGEPAKEADSSAVEKGGDTPGVDLAVEKGEENPTVSDSRASASVTDKSSG